MMLSRVADSLYWIGRYCERAEHACRLLQITLTAALEGGQAEADSAAERALRALGAAPLAARAGSIEEARVLAFGRDGVGSVLESVEAARENARQVRDQITTEMWERLNKLYFRVREAAAAPDFALQAFGFFDDAIGDLHAFKGIVEGTMSHSEGFRFLSLGRAIERAQLVSGLLNIHFGERPGKVADFGWVQLLRMCCGLEPFLRAKTADFRREQLADFLILDPDFPRSLRYCAGRINEHISAIAPHARGPSRDACTRLAGQLKARLEFASLDEVMGRSGQVFIAQVSEDCARINDAVHAAFVTYPLEERLPGAT